MLLIFNIYSFKHFLICLISAAELAAKKSRLKQKLVKSARSVAIFSLKLKERRQREAEKAAAIAVEHAKVSVNKFKQNRSLQRKDREGIIRINKVLKISTVASDKLL